MEGYLRNRRDLFKGLFGLPFVVLGIRWPEAIPEKAVVGEPAPKAAITTLNMHGGTFTFSDSTVAQWKDPNNWVGGKPPFSMTDTVILGRP